MKPVSKCLIFGFWLLTVFIGLVVICLGFFPPVSRVIGVYRPRDLKIGYDYIDLSSAQDKTKVEVVKLTEADLLVGGGFRHEGSHEVSEYFTSRELTALANSSSWIYYPVSSVQVRINIDKTFEVSGLIEPDRLGGYLEATNNIDSYTARVLKVLSQGQEKIPFYLHGWITVWDNQVDLTFQEMEIGRVSLPLFFANQGKGEIESYLEERLGQIKGLSIRWFLLEGDRVKFIGTLPEVETVNALP